MKSFWKILFASFAMVPLAATVKAADVSYAPPDAVVSSGIYIRGDLGASYLNWDSANQNWAYVGDAGIGYQLNDNWRADVTYNWTGGYGLNPGEVRTGMVLGTAYYDFKNSSSFTPYVGAGVGYGWEWGNGAATDVTGVAIGLNAGVAYEMTNNLALDVGYRFHDIINSTQNTQEHQIAAGVRVKF
ncbi:outer membrane beta-barrel protein [Aestuariivirga litoralis]|uniref:outer membrane beta-barrel protein n=1 Tax=Aestuariivirga litoralis TaxID=2650924 RepID=UPI0018C6F775|nr:porin family protein [Aestuariivirga litoralis]